MKLRYIGSFELKSGSLFICDPRGTLESLSYYGIDGPAEKYRYGLNAKPGFYNVYTTFYTEKIYNAGYMSYSSHMLIVPADYNGARLILQERCSDIQTGLSHTVCAVDAEYYDLKEKAFYGVVEDAVYNRCDLLKHRECFEYSDTGKLGKIKDEYLTGRQILDMCQGAPDLCCSQVSSTHWSEDVVARAALMDDHGVMIYGGAAVATPGNFTRVCIYSSVCGHEVIVCSLGNFDFDVSGDTESHLRLESVKKLSHPNI